MVDHERHKIISYLKLSDFEPWVLDRKWEPEVNSKIQKWITEYYIHNTKTRWFSYYRDDIFCIWNIFQEWLEHSQIVFNFRNIQPDILISFEEALPSMGWSNSAIFYIEILLMKIREYLHKHKILRCKGHTSYINKAVPELSWKDYNDIRTRIMVEGHDFERVFFDLISLNKKLQYNIMSIKGSQVSFRKSRAFINFVDKKGSRIKMGVVCPSPVSRMLLLLLRRRNILSDDCIFNPSGLGLMVKPNRFDQKIIEICKSNRIPAFAQESIHGYFERYMNRLVKTDASFINQKDSMSVGFSRWLLLSQSKLKIIDEVYDLFIHGKKQLIPTFAPNPFFMDNCR